MVKQAISVTLDADNITWLKGRVVASGGRSISELLDQIVSAARSGGQAGTSRSVVGTIGIDDSDPMLEEADTAIQSLFETALGRPALARERRATYGRAKTRRG
jgi:hypothetical protein